MRYRAWLYLSLILLCPAVPAAAYNASFGATSNGMGSASSANYRSSSTLAFVSGDSASNNYRNFPGFLSASLVVVDDLVTFLDPSPVDTLHSRNVTARITVQKEAGVTEISTVSYSISNAGSGSSSFGPWLGDAVLESSSNGGNTLRYRITIPSFFQVSNNNYIKWRVNYSATHTAFSSPYRITITEDNPAITVLQPDKKGGRAGTQPVIQARIAGGADLATLRVVLADSSGNVVLQLTGVDNPSIYNPSTETVYYKYEGSPLIPGRTYKLTIYNGLISQEVDFVVQGGAIADLVPYPSPFDPKVRPVTIRYVLNERADVTMNIYDMSGRLVRNIVNNESRSAGIVEEQWNATNYSGDELANGVYICELVAKDGSGEHRRYTSLAVLGK